MRDDQALDLAVRLTQYFPRGGLSTAVWEHKLKRCEFKYANEALAKLVDTSTRPPTWADFVHVYRPPRREHGHCERCDGGGWVPVNDHRRHAAHCPQAGECGCHAVEPCSCSAGDEMRPGYERILARRPPARTTTPHANPQENP